MTDELIGVIVMIAFVIMLIAVAFCCGRNVSLL